MNTTYTTLIRMAQVEHETYYSNELKLFYNIYDSKALWISHSNMLCMISKKGNDLWSWGNLCHMTFDIQSNMKWGHFRLMGRGYDCCNLTRRQKNVCTQNIHKYCSAKGKKGNLVYRKVRWLAVKERRSNFDGKTISFGLDQYTRKTY